MAPSSYSSIRHSAAAFGVSERTMLRRCAEKDVKCKFENGRWWVLSTELPSEEVHEAIEGEHPATALLRRLAPMPDLMTMEQVADVMEISVHSVRSGIKRRHIKVRRIGGIVRVSKIHVAELMGLAIPRAEAS
ncbi:MAG TPA: hypothetical protein PK020_17170 [Ilumatobacteraceae bacterium]|nr:hypothetical protein [Ilumatobacteraceae bacterium]HRB04123.1 hypothetical protein [Ilumatobacteraceae bacterium]